MTVVMSDPLPDLGHAERWLRDARNAPDALDREIDTAAAVLNRMLHAHRVATMDPYVSEIPPSAAVSIRVGYGSGDELVNGGWSDAVEASHRDQRRRRRIDALRPQERLAALLAGRERAGVYETLLIRARLDLDQGRSREAALQLQASLAPLLDELRPATRSGTDQASDLDEAASRRQAIAEIASRAAKADLSGPQRSTVAETLQLCERALRRRRIAGG